MPDPLLPLFPGADAIAREREDDRLLPRAALLALAAHLALAAVYLPARPADSSGPPRPQAPALPLRPLPPPPEPEPTPVPELPVPAQPVPDPTPDDPEPRPAPAEPEPRPALPALRLVLEVPPHPPASEAAEPRRLDGKIVPPEKLFAPLPRYPEAARRLRREGVVIVEAVVDSSGRVAGATVVHSVPLLDEAAVSAVRQWRFRPATLAGRPVAVYYTLTVSFRLR